MDSVSNNSEDWLGHLSGTDHDALLQLLAISAKQLDDGDFGDSDMEKLLAEGRARRAGAIAAE